MPSSDTTLPEGHQTCPENLQGNWRYLALTGERVPLRGMTTATSPEYWEGLEPDWEAVSSWVTDGNAVGILPERSGLVVIDCDSARVWETNGGTARMVRQHGLDDLKRVADECGERIPATFTVSTKSDGYHFYYAQNPLCPVASRGHREGWRIDVKASRNTFAVAPPTPGYSVVRDLPVAELPLWLAQWIQGLYTSLDPLGGASQRRRMGLAVAMKSQLLRSGDPEKDNLFTRWCQAMLSVVESSNQFGGWNNAIYLTAHEFFDVGLTMDEVLPMVLEAANPYDDQQARSVSGTVDSAWRKHQDGTGYGYTSEV